MSPLYDTSSNGNAPQPGDGTLSAKMRQILAPLVHQMVESNHAHRILETRKATQREISHLPVGLQQDLAFSNGTVIPFRTTQLYG